jgi:hypothetical protein
MMIEVCAAAVLGGPVGPSAAYLRINLAGHDEVGEGTARTTALSPSLALEGVDTTPVAIHVRPHVFRPHCRRRISQVRIPRTAIG